MDAPYTANHQHQCDREDEPRLALPPAKRHVAGIACNLRIQLRLSGTHRSRQFGHHILYSRAGQAAGRTLFGGEEEKDGQKSQAPEPLLACTCPPRSVQLSGPTASLCARSAHLARAVDAGKLAGNHNTWDMSLLPKTHSWDILTFR